VTATLLRRLVLVTAFLAVSSAGRAADEAPPPAEERVYLTVDKALKETFPKAAQFAAENRVVGPETRRRIEETLGRPVDDDTVRVYRALNASGGLLGYGVVSDEIGKYHPITFLVGATPEFKVERVTVLVYRESHGADVRRARFLNQYRGKSASSPIRINDDIVNISGATMSVRSLNFGVRKVLSILEDFYAPSPPGKP
jgi:Na+-translocating ferredoxin:NAD+ oxidoreductase RnfG subunit